MLRGIYSLMGVNNHWTGLLEWTTGMDYWNGLLEWTTGMDYWNGLLEWTTGMDYWNDLCEFKKSFLCLRATRQLHSLFSWNCMSVTSLSMHASYQRLHVQRKQADTLVPRYPSKNVASLIQESLTSGALTAV